MNGHTLRRLAPFTAALVIAFAAPAGLAKRAPPPPPPLDEVMTMRVEGAVTIDANGKVLSFDVATKLPDAVRARLDKAIPAWTFKPIAFEGGASSATVPMSITIGATKVADGHALRLEDAAFGSGIDRSTRLATRTWLQSPYRSTDAIVRVAARVDAEGHATDTASLGCTLYNAGGDWEEKALMCRRLEALSVESVQLAMFRKYNMAFPGTTEVTVYFEPSGPMDDRPGRWRVESRTGLREVAWHRAWLASMPASPIVLRDGYIGAAW